MKLVEMFSSDFGENAQQTADDRLGQKRLEDTRKPVVTLDKLNRLRKLRELKKFQELTRDSLTSIMYGSEEEGGF